MLSAHLPAFDPWANLPQYDRRNRRRYICRATAGLWKSKYQKLATSYLFNWLYERCLNSSRLPTIRKISPILPLWEIITEKTSIPSRSIPPHGPKLCFYWCPFCYCQVGAATFHARSRLVRPLAISENRPVAVVRRNGQRIRWAKSQAAYLIPTFKVGLHVDRATNAHHHNFIMNAADYPDFPALSWSVPRTLTRSFRRPVNSHRLIRIAR